MESLIIAHRGFNGVYPEMTRLAYEKALELPGLHGVETDVRLSADGQVMCTHDANTLRTTGEKRWVSMTDAARLKSLNCAHGTRWASQSMLTLDELIEIVFAHDDKHLYIETKHPHRHGRMLEEQVCLRLRYHGLLDSERVHVISFSHAAIRRIGKLAPALETFYLRRNYEQFFDSTRMGWSRPSGYGISIAHAKLHPERIDAPTAPTYMWTVNEEEDIYFALEQGVRVISTDFPDRALAIKAGFEA